MKKILIVVDYQNDFVNPNGVLPVPNATKIKDNIQEMIENDSFDEIIYTMDTHKKEEYETSEEKEIFPNIHCEIGTNGWDLYQISPRRSEISTYMEQRFIEEGTTEVSINEEHMFVKNKFDIWEGNKTYPEWFQKRFDKNTEIYITGVATNYCVYFNAIGYIQRGYKNVFLISECIEGIQTLPTGEEDPTYKSRYVEMIQNGIKVKNKEEV